MKNTEEEYYVFLKSCENDFRVALKSFTFIEDQEFSYHQLVYLRDAVVSYGRPFSGNKGIHTNRHRLEDDIVPKAYMELHSVIMNYRNTLFAHSDIKERNPSFMKLGHSEDETFVIDSEPLYLSTVKEELVDMAELIKEIQKTLVQKLSMSGKNL